MKKTIFALSIITLMGCTNTGKDNTNTADESSTTTKVTEKASTDDNEAAVEESEEVALTAQEIIDEIESQTEGIKLGLWGLIGDSHAELDMNGLTGSYSYGLTNGEAHRRLEFESWDKKTGHLVLRAYEQNSDKFIGKFDGTYEYGNATEGEYDEDGEEILHWVESYDGVFTNYKGAKVKFHLWFD